jgi:hypothetical protein
MACATSSFPLPLSPLINTVAVVPATSDSISRSDRICLLSPIICRFEAIGVLTVNSD